MTKPYEIDEIDRKILDMLKKNARMQWREIGEEIHLTGQAVGERVRRLVDNQVITGFHANVHDQYKEAKRIDYLTIILTSGEHRKFIQMVEASDQITELYRISGDGCYMMKVESRSQVELNQIMDRLLQYAEYKLTSAVKQYK